MINKKITIWAFLLVSFFSVMSFNSFAEESVEEVTKISKEIINKPIEVDGENIEYAHKWFKEIFGAFIFAPWDSKHYKADDVTLVSKAVGFTNILALMLGVVIVYYVFIGGAINAAGKGEVMGQNWSATWLPLRTMIGFGLIMPIGKIGAGVISIAQVFIIWLIMLGSNAASSLWYTLSSEMTEGTTLTSPGVVLHKNQVAEIAKMMACAKMNHSLGSSNEFFTYELLKKIDVEDSWLDNKTFIIEFKEKGRFPVDAFKDVSKSVDLNNPIVSVNFGEGGECGSFTFPTTLNSSDPLLKKDEAKTNMIKKAQSTINKNLLSNVFYPIAAIMDELYSDINGGKVILPQMVKAVNTFGKKGLTGLSDYEKRLYARYESIRNNFSRVGEYYSLTLPNEINEVIKKDEKYTSELKKSLTHGGWVTAGMFFHEIGQISSLNYRILMEYFEEQEAAGAEICGGVATGYYYILNSIGGKETCGDVQEEYASSMMLISKWFNFAVEISDKKSSISDQIKAQCIISGECSINTDLLNKMSVGWGEEILVHFAQHGGIENPLSGNNASIVSPYETLTSMGNRLISYANIGIAAGVAITAIRAYKDDPNSRDEESEGSWTDNIMGVSVFKGLGRAAAAVIGEWVLPILQMVIVALFSLGFVLAFMLPFMPIATWTLMLIGYLVTVIEAVIAAPLAVILMVTPEGEGIAGTRLERAMQLIATAILRPSLMIIGLIASITVGFIGFQIWNMFFFKSAQTILTGSLYDFLFIIIIYVTICFQITKLTISIMHRLPDQILEWFSSGVSRPFGEGEVSQNMETSTSEIKQQGQQIGQSTMQAFIGARGPKSGGRSPH